MSSNIPLPLAQDEDGPQTFDIDARKAIKQSVPLAKEIEKMEF